MQDSGLVPCPEVEQFQPCIYFGKGLCPSCYAELDYPSRMAVHRHGHPRTPLDGVIRLGVNLEILPTMWETFKRGEGVWLCCKPDCKLCRYGEHTPNWIRPDFRTRPYYLITRGLADSPFYERVLADKPYIRNIQVSVDVLNHEFKPIAYPGQDAILIPDRERLAWFNQFPDVMFRFKTTDLNVHTFVALQEELRIPTYRIMETPLRIPGHPHLYGTTTPLEKIGGWPTRTFGRCNTKCEYCVKENGVLLCAVNGVYLKLMPSIVRPPPYRLANPQVKLPEGAEWRDEAVLCMRAHGGHVTLPQAKIWLLRKYPDLEYAKGSWYYKFRVAIQRVGMRVCPTCGARYMRPKWGGPGTTEPPIYDCTRDGTRLPSVWHLRPGLNIPLLEELIPALRRR